MTLNAYLPDQSAPVTDQKVVNGLCQAADGSPYILIKNEDIGYLIHPRKDFTHKGTYGHALIIAGAQDTMGAALLTSGGCLYAGAGLTTACIPDSGLTALNATHPEIMFLSRHKAGDLNKYDVIAIGPGLGREEEGKSLLKGALASKKPIVLDADAINLLSENEALKETLPHGIILTPHIKEFDRLFGKHDHWYARLQTGIAKAKKYQMVIVLKNQYTFIIDKEGTVYINSTGHPAMAQGGMGDALTGIIAGFLAQGYNSRDAAVAGCYVHGKAGTTLAIEQFTVTASQVTKQIPITLKSLIS